MQIVDRSYYYITYETYYVTILKKILSPPEHKQQVQYPVQDTVLTHASFQFSFLIPHSLLRLRCCCYLRAIDNRPYMGFRFFRLMIALKSFAQGTHQNFTRHTSHSTLIKDQRRGTKVRPRY
jgi:hypothetical protein